MDPSFGTEGDEFRGELRAWLDEHLPADLDDPSADDDEMFDRSGWNRTLFEAGYAAIDWPSQFGGRDASVLEQLVYNEEMARGRLLRTGERHRRGQHAPADHDPRLRRAEGAVPAADAAGDEIWSQGMSEPDAGSDLASLQCRAVRDGDRFIVNGQKTWNSLGHRADWCQLYVRTDPSAPKHEGMTCLLVDMRTPGIEARPIPTMGGASTSPRCSSPTWRFRSPPCWGRSAPAGTLPPGRSASSAPGSPSCR
ncbi:MAG: acyl-CoA dehydrogenase family protein [Acidimicrobiales bacterium]